MNSKRTTDHIIAAIDVGTTKICTLIAHQRSDGNLEIIGIGKAPSSGLARGVVVDIAPAIASIKASLEEAQLMASCTIEAVVIGISGSHIQAHQSQGIVALKGRQIRQSDILNVVSAAKAIPLAQGQQILHVLPQFFIIDGQQRVRDPLGMHGVRLEAQVHIITGSIASVQNLVHCCEMAGVKVSDIILEPLASADAVLSYDERELGVALLDIGGGTSDFAVYQHNALYHTRIFPLAGNLFTHDIAVCLHTTLKDAERIKKEYGHTLFSSMQADEVLEIEMVQGNTLHTIYRSDLIAVLQARAQELISFVKQECDQYHLKTIAQSGLVLTGGGSLLQGLSELTSAYLQIPVRIGKPQVPFTFHETLENPLYATGYGLLVQAHKKSTNKMEHIEGPMVNRIFWRMKSWVLDFF
ncbi:MAG: cell division protein FtsA [Candidatus Babeliaceae bacterium]